VSKCQRKYRHWHKVRIIAQQKGLDPELVWAGICLARGPQQRKLPLLGFGNRPLRYMTIDLIQRHISQIDRRMVPGLDSRGRPLTDEQREAVIYTALHEEAITSSLLEGAATTRREAKAMLEAKTKPRNRGEQMVMNNFNAIEFIRQNLHQPLSPKRLLQLQSILTRDTLDDPGEVGRFRRAGEDIVVKDVRSGDTMHKPPPAEELPDRLERLCAFANQRDDLDIDDDDFVHPVIRAIAVHFQIGFDHPFCDGNGRTARALFYWTMLRQDYRLFEYLPISRYIYRKPRAYQEAYQYTETDGMDLTYFLVYHLRIIQQAIEHLADHLRQEKARRRHQRRTARPIGINNRQWEALQALRSEETVRWTVAEYEQELGVSYGTARSELLDLEARGHLRKIRIGRRFTFHLNSAAEETAD
jgi:Fic family protein